MSYGIGADTGAVQGLDPPITPTTQQPFRNITSIVTPYDPLEPAWTASRCRRALRPLISRLAAIRQLSVERAQRISTNADNAAHIPQKKRRFSDNADRSDGESGERLHSIRADPDWDPDTRPAKRVRVTYRSKSCAAQRQNATSKGSGKGDSTKPQKEEIYEHANRLGRYHKDKLGAELASSRQYVKNRCTFSQLGMAFENLLRVTASQRPAPATGVDSLFNLCLKKVPLLIDQESALHPKQDIESQSQASNQIYEDLEAWGSTTGGGWKPLRTVVRAHGVKAMCEAFVEKILPIESLAAFADICYRLNARREGDLLCDAAGLGVRVAPVRLQEPEPVSSPVSSPGVVFETGDSSDQDELSICEDTRGHRCFQSFERSKVAPRNACRSMHGNHVRKPDTPPPRRETSSPLGLCLRTPIEQRLKETLLDLTETPASISRHPLSVAVPMKTAKIINDKYISQSQRQYNHDGNLLRPPLLDLSLDGSNDLNDDEADELSMSDYAMPITKPRLSPNYEQENRTQSKPSTHRTAVSRGKRYSGSCLSLQVTRPNAPVHAAYKTKIKKRRTKSFISRQSLGRRWSDLGSFQIAYASSDDELAL